MNKRQADFLTLWSIKVQIFINDPTVGKLKSELMFYSDWTRHQIVSSVKLFLHKHVEQIPVNAAIR